MKPKRPSAGRKPVRLAAPAEKPGASQSTRSLCQTIAAQPFFEVLKPRQIEVLASLAMEVHFEPGQLIFRQGDPANRFYLILQGRVELEIGVQDGSEISMRSLGPGDEAGWSWLLTPGFFRTNARAVVPTRTLFFYGTVLRQHCEDDHDLGYEIMKRVIEAVVDSFDGCQNKLLKYTSPVAAPSKRTIASIMARS